MLVLPAGQRRLQPVQRLSFREFVLAEKLLHVLTVISVSSVSQAQTSELECEGRRAIEQKAGSCFIVDSVSRIADE